MYAHARKRSVQGGPGTEGPSQHVTDNGGETGPLGVLQAKANNSLQARHTAQLREMLDKHSSSVTLRQQENRTGMPGPLKAGLERISGMDLSSVRVHYNSSKPAQLQAHAYTQGKDIHVAPGQERHLPHEGWHVVQQMQGRVQPTTQLQGTAINDDRGLEREADRMGARALRAYTEGYTTQLAGGQHLSGAVLQAQWIDNEDGKLKWSEEQGGLRWYFDPETRNMAFESVSSEQELPKELQGLEGKWLPHGEWLKKGWWLKSSPGKPSAEPDFGKLVSTGEKRYVNMTSAMETSKGGQLSKGTQEARDWYFENYYTTYYTTESESEPEIKSDFKYPPDNPSIRGRGEYHNKADFDSGRMVASHNFALEGGGEKYYNPESGKAETMTNSEILYQQWKHAAQETGSKMPQMKELLRSRISGSGWKATRVILEQTEQKKENEPIYEEGTPGFYALLAVPNVTAAVWLVVDHGAELGIKGIQSIQVTRNFSALIKFKLA